MFLGNLTTLFKVVPIFYLNDKNTQSTGSPDLPDSHMISLTFNENDIDNIFHLFYHFCHLQNYKFPDFVGLTKL